jgi:hypothetical protein
MNAPEKVVFPGHSTGLWSLVRTANGCHNTGLLAFGSHNNCVFS